MAKIGMEYIVAAKLDAENAKDKKTAKYTGALEIGPGAKVTGTPSVSDVKDYGDDRAVATDTSVTGGTLSLELNEETLAADALLLGHTLGEDKKSMSHMEKNSISDLLRRMWTDSTRLAADTGTACQKTGILWR